MRYEVLHVAVASYFYNQEISFNLGKSCLEDREVRQNVQDE